MEPLPPRRELHEHRLDIRVMRERGGLLAGGLRRGLFESGDLVATYVETLQHELRENTLGRPLLTRENPYLIDHERSSLGDDGFIRLGEVVHEETVLASILQPTATRSGQRTPVEDASWRVSWGLDGAIVVTAYRDSSEGRRHEFPRGVLERLTITLERKVPFLITDAFTWEGNRLNTTCVIDDELLPVDRNGQCADLIVSHAIADLMSLSRDEVRTVTVKRRGGPAVDALRVCPKGHYSLISEYPSLMPHRRQAGQMIDSAQLAWFAERGLFGLLDEFCSLKSDDLQNRPKLNAFASGEGDLAGVIAAAPESLFELTAYLTALGLSVETRSGTHCVELTLRPASSDEVESLSNGKVSKPETIEYRTFRPTAGGLFCETILGEEGSLRRRRFGHFELPDPIIPVIWRLGPQHVLATILGIAPPDLEQIVERKAEVHVVNDGWELRELQFDQWTQPQVQTADRASGWGTGAEAIGRMLESLPQGRIPPAFGPRGERFFLRNIAIIPADLRPLVLLDSGSFATSDLNEFYRQIINRGNRLSKLKQLNAPPVIINNEVRELQSCVDSLCANHLIGAPLRADSGVPLKSLLELISRNFIDRDGKPVEWCGRARAVVDATVEGHSVGIPELIFDALRLSPSQPILLTSRKKTFLARYPTRLDDQLIHLNLRDGESLLQGEPIVVVHRPLTAAGIAEARSIVDGAPAPFVAPPDHADFLRHDDDDKSRMLGSLIDTAMHGATVAMTSPKALSACGTGATQSRLPDGTRRKQQYEIIIPKREPAPLPTIEQIDAVVGRHARKSCLFRVERAANEPPPEAGRLGGFPWMPKGSLWPMLRTDEPMEFVGQFPLDPACQAGALPFDVPPGSLLTVFWNCEMDMPGSRQDGALIIHSSENLVRLDPPNTDYEVLPLCTIRPEIREIFPSLEETLEILEWELDVSSKQKLKKLLAGHGERYFNPDDLSRIGGYPHWVQYPEPIEFVAQITSNDRIIPLSFGDAGSLYIHGSDPENLASFIQCY